MDEIFLKDEIFQNSMSLDEFKDLVELLLDRAICVEASRFGLETISHVVLDDTSWREEFAIVDTWEDEGCE